MKNYMLDHLIELDWFLLIMPVYTRSEELVSVAIPHTMPLYEDVTQSRVYTRSEELVSVATPRTIPSY